MTQNLSDLRSAGRVGGVNIDNTDVQPEILDRSEFPDASFTAIAPVGTGDFWGFPATAGPCHDQVAQVRFASRHGRAV